MKQINDHTPLPWEEDIGDICHVIKKYNHLYVLDERKNDDIKFILTACNNFYKMKDMIKDHRRAFSEGVTIYQRGYRIDKIDTLLKELDK